MNKSFRNKVIYAAAIALLWFPLFFIGQPAAVNEKGGKLPELRREYDLAAAELGEIDPTSESMKLATLGMRGIAVNVLWWMAQEYKMKEDYGKFSATVNQIALLQPNFIEVWKFQAHNESFNVSVVYDDYKMRYAWVKKGMDLLIRGTQYNRKDTQLLNFLGWFFTQKIGRSDESKQFRRLFRDDKDFHARLRLEDAMGAAIDSDDMHGPDQKPDNWLVGRWWQLRAEDRHAQGAPLRGKSPLLFFNDAPLMRMYYCKALEQEGWFGSESKLAWKLAGEDWVRYGHRAIPTTWGYSLELESLDAEVKRLDQIKERLVALAPGERERIRQEKVAKLPENERKAFEIPQAKRTIDEGALAYQADLKTRPTAREIADRAPAENRREARQAAQDFMELAERVRRIDIYRGIVNYTYWKTRAELEQSDTALSARRHMYDAEQARIGGRLEAEGNKPGAKELYEMAWQEWAAIYAKYPKMMDDPEADNLVDAIKYYEREVLKRLDINSLPADFPLSDFLTRRQQTRGMDSMDADRIFSDVTP